MQKSIRKIVLSGGPSAGKTETINVLMKSGVAVLQEVAISIIESRKKDLSQVAMHELIRSEEFSHLVYEEQIHREKYIDISLPFIVLDGCLYDCIAHHVLRNFDVPEKLAEAAPNAGYDLVLFMNILPEEYWNKTINGKPRANDYSYGKKVNDRLWGIYQKTSILCYEVPVFDSKGHVMGIEERGKLVCRYIEQFLADQSKPPVLIE